MERKMKEEKKEFIHGCKTVENGQVKLQNVSRIEDA